MEASGRSVLSEFSTEKGNTMISVIVLIYNLENELPDCIDSLRKIPGTGEDMEFILIDDGSTDSSGRIADHAVDPRFRVFHTENRGYGAAINYGLEQARGEWIMLVDGDDWVEPGFCDIPLKAAQEFNADIVIFDFRAWKNGILWEELFSEKVNRLFQKLTGKTDTSVRPYGIIDEETAMKKGEPSDWGKIYRKELFDQIRYPEGREFVDVIVTYRLFHAAKRIAMIPDILYDYRVRSGSIAHTWSEKYKRDCFLSAMDHYMDLKKWNYPPELHRATVWNSALTFMMITECDDEDVRKAARILDSIPGIPSEMPLKNRLMLRAWKTDPKLFRWICRLQNYGKK